MNDWSEQMLLSDFFYCVEISMQIFCKIGILKNFWQNPQEKTYDVVFFNRVADLQPTTL